jgi:arylsulfatase A-like enzyme
MTERPNIILFNPDQWRGDVLGHAGNPAAVTPNLDLLAQTDGVSFQNAFCQNPVCTPSRCSFMTGWYPHVRGHRTMFHMLRPDEPCLLKTLKDEGYYVWWGGKNDLVPGQNSLESYCSEKFQAKDVQYHHHQQSVRNWRGDPDADTFFSFYIGKIDAPAPGTLLDSDWANVLGAVDFLRRATSERPFCIYLSLSYPHPPYGVEEPWYSMIARDKVPQCIPSPLDWHGKPSILKGIYHNQHMQTWDEERWLELRATYYGMCSRVDHQFGLIMQALRESGLYDDTAVFFFSDHGDFAGDYGLVEKTQNTFEDCLTHVPLLVKPPGGEGVQPGLRHPLVELIDISATVEDMLNLQPAHTHFGRSLLPLIAGEVEKHRDAVFCEGGRLHGETHCMEAEVNLDEGRFLYAPRLSLQRGEGPEHTKAVMCRTQRYKYVRRLHEDDELYDLQADPGEQVNRIHDPALTDELIQLKERLLTFFLETGDVVPYDIDRRW